MRLPAAMVVTLLLTPLVAQVDDDQTEEHERQDRRYLERLSREQPAPQRDDAASRAERREQFLRRAEELVRDKNLDADSSEHYRVQTDDPRLDARAATALLESFRGHFGAFWTARGLEPALPETRSRVFLFYSFYKYNQLLAGDWRFQTVRPAGHYINAVDVVAAHTSAGDAAGLADSLVHEAAHQLVDQALLGGELPPAPWLGEGLASYFGYTLRDEQGVFRPPQVGPKRAGLMRGESGRRSAEPAARLRALRRALAGARRSEDLVIDGVLRLADPARFYSGDAEVHYAASWMTVHYLLHGDEGRHAAAFAGLLRRGGPDAGSPEALYEATGLGPRELEEAVAAHVKQVKLR